MEDLETVMRDRGIAARDPLVGLRAVGSDCCGCIQGRNPDLGLEITLVLLERRRLLEGSILQENIFCGRDGCIIIIYDRRHFRETPNIC